MIFAEDLTPAERDKLTAEIMAETAPPKRGRPRKSEQPMTYKERYAELKAQHRCVGCKKALPVDYTKVRCEHCLDYNRESHRRKAELEKRRQADALRKRHNVTLTISQVVKLAAQRHVSYGEMVAIIERGGTL